MPEPGQSLERVSENLVQGIKHKKCHVCGCQQGTVKAIQSQLGALAEADAKSLVGLLDQAVETFGPVKYDCLGCAICFPALAAEALNQAYSSVSVEEACGNELDAPLRRPGWPPLPGNYQNLRYAAPVAICTLNDVDLMEILSRSAPPGLAITGTLRTENLGIERLIQNILANPNIRVLILCGADSEQKIGHLPGASMLALAAQGVDERGHIIGAPGRRPVLKNIDRARIDRFRRQVRIVDAVGERSPEVIVRLLEEHCAAALPPFEEPVPLEDQVPVIEARIQGPLVLDPQGYFVIDLEPAAAKIRVEHYDKQGLLLRVVKGEDPAAIYMTLIELGALSRLDHASYLGKELARAHQSLLSRETFVQDKAQERDISCDGKECC